MRRSSRPRQWILPTWSPRSMRREIEDDDPIEVRQRAGQYAASLLRAVVSRR